MKTRHVPDTVDVLPPHGPRYMGLCDGPEEGCETGVNPFKHRCVVKTQKNVLFHLALLTLVVELGELWFGQKAGFSVQ